MKVYVPPLWEDGRRGWDSKDCHIEEHEVNAWAASGNVETYEEWKGRPYRAEREARAK